MNPARLMRLAGVSLLALATGCTPSPPAAPAPLPAKFDPGDVDTTFRWLIQVATPIHDELGALSKQRYANPLQKDFQAEEDRVTAKWEKSVAGLHGKKVVWPAVVKEITEQGLYVDGWPEGYSIWKGDYRLYLEYEGMTSRPPHGGFLHIGGSVTLDDARKLLPNSWVYISGVIEEVRASLRDSGPYITVSIVNTRVIIPEPVPSKR
jgi:hypothetical protein